VTDKPRFNQAFRDQLEELILMRRDVRHFNDRQVPPDILDECLHLASRAPSVGHSQPWRIVKVQDPSRRHAVANNFEQANAKALQAYEGEVAADYSKLKLAGLREANVHVAFFADTKADTGKGLGSASMPEAKTFSVVSAIQILWLALRAHGIGLGWVSIFDPDIMAQDLDVDPDWVFIGYLCIGYPVEESDTPELIKTGWQDRLPFNDLIFDR
jgi:5,6-dimethylbenzimidazole synthase